MNAKTFTEACYKEKEDALKTYMGEHIEYSESDVSILRRDLNLTDEQNKIFRKLLDVALTDTYITLLYSLDGCHNLGGEFQEVFKITCENGDVLSTCGDLEAAAYESFHENGQRYE